jgi:hypothetical protein
LQESQKTTDGPMADANEANDELEESATLDADADQDADANQDADAPEESVTADVDWERWSTNYECKGLFETISEKLVKPGKKEKKTLSQTLSLTQLVLK